MLTEPTYIFEVFTPCTSIQVQQRPTNINTMIYKYGITPNHIFTIFVKENVINIGTQNPKKITNKNPLMNSILKEIVVKFSKIILQKMFLLWRRLGQF